MANNVQKYRVRGGKTLEIAMQEASMNTRDKIPVAPTTHTNHGVLKIHGGTCVRRHNVKETQDHNYTRKLRKLCSQGVPLHLIKRLTISYRRIDETSTTTSPTQQPPINEHLPRPQTPKVVPWARALPAAAAGEAAAEEPASMSDVLEAAEAEAAAGSEVAVVATADTEPASGGDGAAATVVEVEDPQDSAAAESDSDAAKSKRTVASSLGYGAYPGYNALPHDAPPRHHAHHFHAQAAPSHQQTQYNVPAHAQGQQQYQTVRYYPTKGSAVPEEAPRARPEYQIQYQYQLPAQYQPAHHVQQYYSVPQHLLAAASGQQLVYQHPAAAPPAAVPAAHSLFGGQQLIPVILVRVADPSQHGLASAALLPASALGLHAPHAAPAPAPAAHGLSLQALQSLILQHYAQQAPAAPAHAHAHAPQPYYTETPQLTQQQLKQLYAQQQAAAAAAASEGKKPIIPSATQSSSAPQKPRKGASVSIEAAHNLDNSYQQYKFTNYKDKN